MFGYIKANTRELLVKEYEQYKAIYCSLCRQLHKDYSTFAKLILSYDCTLYAIFLLSREISCCDFKKGLCKAMPLKKCNYCINSDTNLKKAAAVSIFLAYYKLLDNINDNKFLKRLFLKLLRLIFKIWHKKAVKNFSEYDVILKEMLKNQSVIEKNPDCNADMAADATAVMMSKIFALEAKNEVENKILTELGYNLGRWIYFMDAVDDIEKDIKHKNFNPFIKSYLNFKDKKDFYTNCKGMLNQCVFQICNAYNLLDILHFEGILYNVFFLGLEFQQNKVLSTKGVELD